MLTSDSTNSPNSVFHNDHHPVASSSQPSVNRCEIQLAADPSAENPVVERMDFTRLFGQDIQSYLDNVFNSQKLLLYVHVPKCAGTSSARTLVDAHPRHWHFEFDKIDERLQLFIDRAKSCNPTVLELAIGHLYSHHIREIRSQGVPHHAITFFRHPIDRLISEYRYMCTPAHPFHRQILECFPTFESFVEEKVPPNAIAEMLFGQVSSFDEYIGKLTETFDFIGLSEFYHLSMALLMKANGKTYSVEPRRNITTATAQNSFKLQHETHQKLCQSQSLDLMVYEYLHKQYAKLSEVVLRNILDGSLRF